MSEDRSEVVLVPDVEVWPWSLNDVAQWHYGLPPMRHIEGGLSVVLIAPPPHIYREHTWPVSAAMFLSDSLRLQSSASSYQHFILKPLKENKDIISDIDRALPNVYGFGPSGKFCKHLHRILSFVDSLTADIGGYTQGMNIVAATLLRAGLSEWDAATCLLIAAREWRVWADVVVTTAVIADAARGHLF